MSNSDMVFMDMMRLMNRQSCQSCNGSVWNPDPYHLPAYDLGTYGRSQYPIIVPNDAPIISSYTGKVIGFGPQPFGMPCDAPKEHPNYGKNFHVIEKNPVNGEYMMHRAHVMKR